MAKRRFKTGSVISISLAHLLHDTFGAFLAPLRPLLIEKHGLSFSLAAALDLFQRLPSLLSPFIGLLADKIHLRWFIILTPAITTIAMSLLGMAPGYIILAILLLVAGLSSAAFHVPSPVMVRQLSGATTGKGMSFYMLGGELARTLGPLVVTAGLSLWGLEGTWKLIPFGLAASVILYFKLHNIRVSEALVEERKKKGQERKAGGELKKYATFFILLTGYLFFRAILKSGLTAFLPTYYFNVKGETLWYANAALAILQLAGAAGSMVSGTVSDLLGRKTTLLVVAVITPILMILFMQTSGVMSIILLVILGVFVMAPTPVLLALIQDLPSGRPAFMNGIFMTISFSIGSVAVLLNGVLGDLVGLEMMYKISAVIAFGALPFVWWLPVSKKE